MGDHTVGYLADALACLPYVSPTDTLRGAPCGRGRKDTQLQRDAYRQCGIATLSIWEYSFLIPESLDRFVHKLNRERDEKGLPLIDSTCTQ